MSRQLHGEYSWSQPGLIQTDEAWFCVLGGDGGESNSRVNTNDQYIYLVESLFGDLCIAADRTPTPRKMSSATHFAPVINQSPDCIRLGRRVIRVEEASRSPGHFRPCDLVTEVGHFRNRFDRSFGIVVAVLDSRRKVRSGFRRIIFQIQDASK